MLALPQEVMPKVVVMQERKYDTLFGISSKKYAKSKDPKKFCP